MLGRQISSRIKLFLHFLPIKKSKEKSADNVNLIESWREILLVMSWGEGGGGRNCDIKKSGRLPTQCYAMIVES